MIDFSANKSGPLDADARFTDLWVSAMATTLTGAILLRTEKGDAVAFFREGNPIHVSGSAFTDNRLGELLVEADKCSAAAVDAAVMVQGQTQGDERKFVGEIILSHGDTSAEAIEDAIEQQIVRRLMQMIGMVDGEWQMAPGENEQLRSIGVPIAAWPVVLPALNASDANFELREFVDSLLGKAVHLVGNPPDESLLGLGDPELQVIELLERPRKPDQIERAVGNRRRARAILRLLDIGEQLDRLPSKKAVPIASTLRIAAPSLTPPPRTTRIEEPEVEERPPAKAQTPPPSRLPSQSAVEAIVATSPLLKELKELHGKLREIDHFELLGVSHETSSRELRMRWTALAKKFHPDALGPNKTESTEKMARETLARINDAYSTLDDEEMRRQYIARIGGGGGGAGATAAGGGGGGGAVNQQGQVEAARVRFEMGNAMLKKGDIKRARDYFHFAMANDGTTPMYKAYYAWAIFADRKAHRKEAIETASTLMITAARECSDDAQVQFYAGKIFRANNDDDRAAKAYNRVLEIDSTHSGARSELRTMNRKSSAPPGAAPAKKSPKGKKKKGKSSDKLGALSKLFKKS